MIAAPEVPERGDQYGLEVWQRIRHKLPEQDRRRGRGSGVRFRARIGLGVRGGRAALLVIAAFVAGRVWPRPLTPAVRGARHRAKHDRRALSSVRTPATPGSGSC